MRKLIFAGMLSIYSSTNLFPQTTSVRLAEDLWGNKVKFDKIIHSPQTTVIQPFSASNCGYCMIDGWFIEKNYMETNRHKGGINFTQSLFNPQLDNYAFIKHYHDTLTPTLTYPPELHQYHQDGFPTILAFRRGEQIIKLPEGSLFPYNSSYEKHKMTLWNDTSIHYQIVSDLQFATRIIYENMNYSSICVLPDGNQDGFERNKKLAERIKCYEVRFLSQLTDEDLEKDMLLEGKFHREVYKYFTGGISPFRLEGDSVLCFGEYRFGVDSIGIEACIPNPRNPGKYMVIQVRGINVEKEFFDNSVDYTIYSYDKKTRSIRVLLHGFFDKKAGNRWTYSGSQCISHLPEQIGCAGVCTIPRKKFLLEHPVKILKPKWIEKKEWEVFTFGSASCRFPSIVTDDQGRAWVCWEENGDILLSSVNRNNPVSIAIEQNQTDSYNPLITFSGGKLWIFYLNNRDGFYRLYGRSFDESGIGESVLFSELLPCDVITPSVVSTKKEIVLAWTYWKSNFRFPFYRTIRNGIPDSIHAISVAKTPLDDYINAWYFSLDTDHEGQVWGAWNQHYPAILGVCAGNLSEDAVPVTRTSEKPDDCENGGYPCAIHDGQGRRWVFWESFPWGVPDGDRQKIYGSTFDPEARTWSPPIVIPANENSYLNQTPQAVTLSDGRIFVIWSGRSRDHTWTLYLACKDKDRWSGPFQLTSGKEPARAPKLISGNHDEIWVACHYGSGKKMKVRVLKLPVTIFNKK